MKRSNISFSESSHVAYQIKANMLSLHTPSTPGVWSKGHIFFFFSKSGHVAYQIKVEEV